MVGRGPGWIAARHFADPAEIGALRLDKDDRRAAAPWPG
jgi:hypothetical protein